jgi:hypothetical protein
MPRETIEIVLSDFEPYHAGAQFFATIAYPDPRDTNARDRYFQAIVRRTLECKMQDKDWRENLQWIRPAYFSGPDQLHARILKLVGKRLVERATAAAFICMPYLQAVDTGKLQSVDGNALSVNKLALLAKLDLGLSEGSISTVKSQMWKPTKPVAHAMCAYLQWHQSFSDKYGRDPNDN